MTTYLFVHQSFPGQYAQLARHLAASGEHRVYFLTQQGAGEIPGVLKILYRTETAPQRHCHPYTEVLDDAIRTGEAVAAVCKQMRRRGIFPDLVIGHGGWGETLMIKDVFPMTPVLSNFEYFYRAQGAAAGFDREFGPWYEDDGARLRVRNAINHMCMDASDWGHTATKWQHSLFPPELQARITTLHEGVDTNWYRPNRQARLKIPKSGIELTCESEVITYVARNLEPCRGFHVFMRALPQLLSRRPKAHVVIVGSDGVSYGPLPATAPSYRELMLVEVGKKIDLTRVHFMGTVDPDVYLSVLQVSTLHVYLTYPFVLSWSLIEAMAVGCLIVGSATPPVLEFLRDDHNAVLVDFFDSGLLSSRLEVALESPGQFAKLRVAARRSVEERLDLQAKILPRWIKLFENLTSTQSPRTRAQIEQP